MVSRTESSADRKNQKGPVNGASYVRSTLFSQEKQHGLPTRIHHFLVADTLQAARPSSGPTWNLGELVPRELHTTPSIHESTSYRMDPHGLEPAGNTEDSEWSVNGAFSPRMR